MAIEINDPRPNARAQLEGEGEDAAEGESASRKEVEKVGPALIMSRRPLHPLFIYCISSKFGILVIGSK